jgi:hypothetical protein
VPRADAESPKRHHLSRVQAQALVYKSWQRTRDRVARTQAARDAFLEQLADEADPEHKWSEAERQAAAEAGRRSHLLRMTARAAVVHHSRVCDVAPPHSKADCPLQAATNGDVP